MYHANLEHAYRFTSFPLFNTVIKIYALYECCPLLYRTIVSQSRFIAITLLSLSKEILHIFHKTQVRAHSFNNRCSIKYTFSDTNCTALAVPVLFKYFVLNLGNVKNLLH